ncbi:MAG: OB-fold domain-containing protein [Rhodobacteraceae bacterium]|jgi:uncharacterized OB-fold protein|nr:OB-fold domain-containing protein [Paracoccaceae bacterium]
MHDPVVELFECAACGHRLSHFAEICPGCLGDALRPVAVPAAAVLESWTLIRRPAPAHAGAGPFAVGVARLAEGGQLVSGRIAGEAEGLGVGSAVTLARDAGGRITIRAAGAG